jgi:hypothetical protein
MSTALTLSPSQIDTLADKLDSLDLSVAEQAALIAALRTGDSPEYVMADEATPAAAGKDVAEWNLPSPGEGLRSAFTAGNQEEVSGFAASASTVGVSVSWSAAAN